MIGSASIGILGFLHLSAVENLIIHGFTGEVTEVFTGHNRPYPLLRSLTIIPCIGSYTYDAPAAKTLNFIPTSETSPLMVQILPPSCMYSMAIDQRTNCFGRIYPPLPSCLYRLPLFYLKRKSGHISSKSQIGFSSKTPSCASKCPQKL